MLNLVFLIGPILCLAAVSMLLPGALSNPPGFLHAALACYGAGFAAIAVAKLRNLRNGQLISFGTADMRNWEKWLYRSGYLLLFVALAMMAALVFSIQIQHD